jgi:hypothetical protein
MHLEMIAQAATGDYSPRPGELEKRKAAIIAFMATGQCVASESDRALSAEVSKVVTSHLAEVTGHPESREEAQTA